MLGTIARLEALSSSLRPVELRPGRLLEERAAYTDSRLVNLEPLCILLLSLRQPGSMVCCPHWCQ